MYNAQLSSGNIFGVAVGVMICASIVHIIGTSDEFANQTPVYLVFGSMSVMGLAALAAVVMALCESAPDHVRSSLLFLFEPSLTGPPPFPPPTRGRSSPRDQDGPREVPRQAWRCEYGF